MWIAQHVNQGYACGLVKLPPNRARDDFAIAACIGVECFFNLFPSRFDESWVRSPLLQVSRRLRTRDGHGQYDHRQENAAHLGHDRF